MLKGEEFRLLYFFVIRTFLFLKRVLYFLIYQQMAQSFLFVSLNFILSRFKFKINVLRNKKKTNN